MDLYRATFAGSVLLNSAMFYRSWHAQRSQGADDANLNSEKVEHRGREESDVEGLQALKWKFFPIFLLVNAADWLQGPYIYPIYKDEKGLPEKTVAFLFLVGFVSAGISASFAGAFADKYGRRTACLAYCCIYSLSCLTLMTDDIIILFVGRVLGGICGTLLYSVFESWLVAEFNKLMLEESNLLSGIFSAMVFGNSLVAICAGVLAEWLVGMTGTAKAPFLGSVVCLSGAFVAISRSWDENYGCSNRESNDDNTVEASGLLEQQSGTEETSPRTALDTVLHDKRILVLGLTSCFFEGSLFLFIFFKFPALTLCHKLSGAPGELPFGLIFAILMCSMMFGSMLYNNLTSSNAPSLPVTRLLAMTLVVASGCFLAPAYLRNESITLWCFCLFEVCCGIYYPLMSYLKGKLIDDSARASVYGFLRVPLNAFVVLALSTTKEGEHHRDLVFTSCSGLLLAAAVVVHRVLT